MIKPDISADVTRTATQWLTRLYAGDPDEDEALQEEFKQWIEASSDHRQAFLKVRALWEDIGMTDAAAATALRLVQPETGRANLPPQARWRWITGAVAASLGCLAILLWIGTHTIETRHYASKVGETRTVTLSDGSKVTLGAGAEIYVKIDGRNRTIDLTRGRALFEVTRQPDSIFKVVSNRAEISVLGTSFTVRRGKHSSTVSVLHGQVSVNGVGQDSGQAQLLGPGERIDLDALTNLGEVASIDANQALDWLTGRLVFDGSPLAEVIHDLNLYRETKVFIADPALEQLRVTTSFRVDQAEQMLEGLTMSHPIRLRRMEDSLLIFAAEPQAANRLP
ncbi:MAG: FecR domain-containing protein [Pseudomonadota bacterium]